MIPEDWKLKRLDFIADVRDGTHDSPKYQLNGVKFVTSKNIINGRLDFSEISMISFSDAEEINKRSKVDKDDLLISMIGTIGEIAYVYSEPDFCIKNIGLIKSNFQRVNPKFLFFNFQSDSYQNFLNKKLDGGIQKFISLNVLRSLTIPLPPTLEEQEKIAEVLSDIDAEIEKMEAKIEKYKYIKKGMMQKLLTGQLRLV